MNRRARNNTTECESTPAAAEADESSQRVISDQKKERGSNSLVIDMNVTPSLGEWLTVSWLDVLSILCLGMIGLGIYFADPAPTRSFPVYFQNREIVYPQFAYPLRNNIIPIWIAAIIAIAVPVVTILLMQLRIRSFWDANNAITGLLYSLIIAATFQVFIKWLIGGLRPHFLTVCKPNIPAVAPEETGNELGMVMYDRKICTGDQKQINDSLESFPSGHSTAAFAGFVFLSIYLNAKLKIWSNYHPAMWKMVILWTPILGATLISASLTIDGFNNWYDCLAGAIIGTVMAFSAYRMVFTSIWDYRTNHIPLNREIPFVNTGSELRSTTATRKSGWGDLHRGTNPENHTERGDVPRHFNISSSNMVSVATAPSKAAPTSTIITPCSHPVRKAVTSYERKEGNILP